MLHAYVWLADFVSKASYKLWREGHMAKVSSTMPGGCCGRQYCAGRFAPSLGRAAEGDCLLQKYARLINIIGKTEIVARMANGDDDAVDKRRCYGWPYGISSISTKASIMAGNFRYA